MAPHIQSSGAPEIQWKYNSITVPNGDTVNSIDTKPFNSHFLDLAASAAGHSKNTTKAVLLEDRYLSVTQAYPLV